MAPGPLQMPHSSSSPTQSSTSSQMPSASASGTGPPQTPRASSLVVRRSRSLLRGCHTSALVDGARAVADAALVVGVDTVVFVVTDAIGIPRSPSPPQTPQGVKLVSVAVAVSFGDVSTSALVDGARSVADAALVELSHAVVDVVTDAIGIGVSCTVTATDAEGVELVAVTVAVSFGDVRTSTLVDGTWSVADAALVEFADAVIDVVTDAIGIGVRCAVTTTDAEGVELVAVTVAVSFGDVSTSALVDGARSVADAALVEFANAVVDVVTDAIGILVRCTVPSTFAKRVELVAVTVAVAFRNVRASTLVDGARSVADAALVVGTDTVVFVVTDAIGVGVRFTVPATDAEGIELVSVAVTVSFGDVRASALVDGARSVRSPLQMPHSS